ncbi:hypothetical protein UFOVP74_5 [uncultured Caudovirales phage]|uniref:Uncharacterized protein n=1 Tax=uncultured Caudovirales phage TaxID=2100421 RepID=A0A6J5L1X0_9CAUD|nr:hypothetical protein UFOVP74_5 [uncultured Caudovirales phage]
MNILSSNDMPGMFAAYLPCKVLYMDIECQAVGINAKEHMLLVELDHTNSGVKALTAVGMQYCKLMLRVMDCLSYSGAIRAAKLLMDEGEPMPKAVSLHRWFGDVLDSNVTDVSDYVTGRQFQRFIDCLRQEHVDVGYLTVPSLIESGLAVNSSGTLWSVLK